MPNFGSTKKVLLKSPFGSESQVIPSKRGAPSSPKSHPSSHHDKHSRRRKSVDQKSLISPSINSNWKTPRNVKSYARFDSIKFYKNAHLSYGIVQLDQSRNRTTYTRFSEPNPVARIERESKFDFTPLRPQSASLRNPTTVSEPGLENVSANSGDHQNWTSERDKSWLNWIAGSKEIQGSGFGEAAVMNNAAGKIKMESENNIFDQTITKSLVVTGLEKAETPEKVGDGPTQHTSQTSEPGHVPNGVVHPDTEASDKVDLNPRKQSSAVNHSQATKIKINQTHSANQNGDISSLDFSKLSIEDRTPKASSHRERREARITRAAQRKIELEKERDQFRITPLNKEWEAKVRDAVRNGHGQLSATDFARVVPEYSMYHNQDNWLNDEVINSYLTMIVDHGKREDRKGQVPSHHAFNSFLYKNLSEKGYQSVRRWANRAKIGGKNFLETEKVFVPINQGMHWTLAVIETKKRIITVYNSMGTSRGFEVASKLLAYMKEEVGVTFDENEWTLKHDGATPQQRNSDDCGVFTITNARQIMLGKDPMDSYSASDIPVQRRRIVAELINGGLLRSEV